MSKNISTKGQNNQRRNANYANFARPAQSEDMASGGADTAISAENAYQLVQIERLPRLLGSIVDMGNSRQEKDLLLLAGLTSLSVCFPKVSGIYNGKRYYPNLYFMAVGPAASGKGKMNLCRNVLMPIHKKLEEESKALGQRKMLLIPANCSATAFQEILSQNQNGCIIFETEGDTLADIFEQDYGNYSSSFRCAFEHEMISYARRENKEYVEIDNPKLSVLLSGTPNQVTKLIKDPENGLFSRFAFYRMEATDGFRLENDSYGKESKDEKCARIGNDVLKVYEAMLRVGRVTFTMSTRQWKRFERDFKTLEEEYYKLYDKSQIRPSIYRLGVIRFRLSMILTVLKALENKALTRELYCDPDSFETARSISSLLAEHMTQVYRLLPSPGVLKGRFRTESEKQLYASLLNHFTRKEFNEKAIALGLNPRSAERYLTAWKKDGFIICTRHGQYVKPQK